MLLGLSRETYNDTKEQNPKSIIQHSADTNKQIRKGELPQRTKINTTKFKMNQ